MSSQASARSEQAAQTSARISVPHPLTIDGWMPHEAKEFSTIRTYVVADVTRAADAISTLALMVHNSLGEPDATGANPLGRVVEQDMLSAMKCLGDYIKERTERMREISAMHARLDEEEAQRG